MAETRVPSRRYEQMARKLIDEEAALAPIAKSEARIAYLASDAKKVAHGKTVFGQCERVPDRYKWAVPFDFAIVLYEPNVAGFTDAKLRTLLLHELMHVGVFHDKEGEEVYKVVPHDVEEFGAIIDRFGRGWWTAEG